MSIYHPFCYFSALKRGKLGMVLFLMLLSNPCLAAEPQIKGDMVILRPQIYQMDMNLWDVKWGDTLSEIAVTLLPGQPEARKKFMHEVVKLNPETFPTQNPDFMLAYHMLKIPFWVQGNNMQQKVEQAVARQQQQQAEDNFEPLYQPPQDLMETEDLETEQPTEQPRFYALAPDGSESDVQKGEKVKDNYQYITRGAIYGALQIEQGPYLLLTPDTRIKISLPRPQENQLCRIELVQGLLRLQERSRFPVHCQVISRYASLFASNADYGVQMCAPKSCLIDTSPEGKAWLPPGLYFGVARGSLQATDAQRQYHLEKGQIDYYAPDKTQAMPIKPFKGLIFTDKELASFAPPKTEKKQFSWGYIKKTPSRTKSPTVVYDLLEDMEDNQQTPHKAQTRNTPPPAAEPQGLPQRFN